ncbi:mechanosensitive ion channel [Rhodocytophaga rosea]|uniref:Mechanosensitive ion channel n=1 Tax=Rhodocytophaga rosea TaxID=2704465 RepID=A0A6C0GQD2_9BACT|nr:mechanosensitive ion channel domain-containing protein [Rhodocytophaga rosea]QHT69720.1 mechanosensitive ion channel [Rhodocytophaga rosea]
MEKFEIYARRIVEQGILFIPSLVLALFTLVVGWWIIGRLGHLASKAMARLDISLRTFLTSIVIITLKILLIISVAGMVGFQTTSFIAILGAAGLAIGLALQGTLSNFAGGVLILIFKPFKVGDVVEMQGQKGVVTEIQIFNSILVTPKGETIILANGAVAGGTIVNSTSEGKLLVEILVDLESNTDIDMVRFLMIPMLQQDERILKDPGPAVLIAELKPGGIVVAFRAYTLPGDNVAVTGSMREKIRAVLAKNNIGSPIPHSFVHTVPMQVPSVASQS